MTGQGSAAGKDYERLPETGVAMNHWAIISRIMLRRLARAAR